MVGRRTEVVGRRMQIEGVVRMYNDVVCRMSAHGCMAVQPSHLWCLHSGPAPLQHGDGLPVIGADARVWTHREAVSEK